MPIVHKFFNTDLYLQLINFGGITLAIISRLLECRLIPATIARAAVCVTNLACLCACFFPRTAPCL